LDADAQRVQRLLPELLYLPARGAGLTSRRGSCRDASPLRRAIRDRASRFLRCRTTRPRAERYRGEPPVRGAGAVRRWTGNGDGVSRPVTDDAASGTRVASVGRQEGHTVSRRAYGILAG